MKTNNIIAGVILIAVVFFIYNVIFSSVPISGGDYISYNQHILRLFYTDPFSTWDTNTGIGSSTLPLLHYGPYNFFIGQIGRLVGYNTVLVERIVWWVPFLLLSFLSTIILYSFVFSKRFLWYLSPFIFLCNTYILLVISGGQIGGIGMAYALAPLIFYIFMKITNISAEEKRIPVVLSYSFSAGLLFALELMLDIRIAYITVVGVACYWLLFLMSELGFSLKKIGRSVLFVFFFPFLITGLIHSFWLLPVFIFRINPSDQFGVAYTSSHVLSFFSFATFENALGLLHPNWPENIFGKVGFMKPEFLFLPILAFSSLLFVNSTSQFSNKKVENNITIFFFVLLALLGMFLAKGTNDPFGFLYTFLFEHIPGFVLFRDPTKWYLLTALSYSMLIPFSVEQIYRWFQHKKTIALFRVQDLFLIIVIVYLLFLIRPALLGHLNGTFKVTPVPQEYITLNTFLTNDKQFSRILWVPTHQRFGTFSKTHPAISIQDFFQTASTSGVLRLLKKPQLQKIIEDSGVTYIIVPDDTEKEIFLHDRTYDRSLYTKTIETLASLDWVTPVQYIDHIAIFKVIHPKEHFWTNDNDSQVTYTQQSPVSYTVQIDHARKNDKLIFSEAFDPFWTAQISSNEHLVSNKYEQFNSFVLAKNGNYSLTIYYEPQKWVTIGLWISALTACIAIVYCLFVRKRQ